MQQPQIPTIMADDGRFAYLNVKNRRPQNRRSALRWFGTFALSTDIRRNESEKPRPRPFPSPFAGWRLCHT